MTDEETKTYETWFAAMGCIDLLFYIYHNEALEEEYYYEKADMY